MGTRGTKSVRVPSNQRHKQHVPEGENFFNMASFEFVNFRGSDTILGTLAQLDRGITKQCKNLKSGCTLGCAVDEVKNEEVPFSNLA